MEIQDLIIEELKRARNDNDAMRVLINDLVQKVTEVVCGVRLMEEKINHIAKTMDRDRTLTATQIDDLSHRVNTLENIRHKGWGIMAGLVIAGGAAGAGIKALFVDIIK